MCGFGWWGVGGGRAAHQHAVPQVSVRVRVRFREQLLVLGRQRKVVAEVLLRHGGERAVDRLRRVPLQRGQLGRLGDLHYPLA